MVEFYGTHSAEPDVMFWAAIAQNKGVIRTNRTVRELLQDAAAKGDPSAMARLGLSYILGEHVKPDAARGLKLIRDAYEKGSSDAAIQLGRAYIYGTGVERDDRQAERYLREALAKGNMRAHGLMADVYRLRGEPVKQLEEIRASADAGDENGMASLAEVCRDGKLGETTDPKLALSWMHKAAQLGQTTAQRELAKMILSGYGGLARDQTNFVAVRKLLEAAVNADDTEAMRILARLCITADFGAAYEPDKTLELLRRAADAGDAAAIYDTGVIYVEGFLVPRDLRRAKELMDAAAAKGYEPAKQYLHRLAPAASTQPSASGTLIPAAQFSREPVKN